MSISLDAFLRARGFSGNPFASTSAEQEREQLASYFLRAPWFDRLVGDPRRPESLVLFAPRGYGKTSHRLEVARLASERRDTPALVATFTAFELLPLPEAEPLNINTYLPHIRQATLEALDDFLQVYPERAQIFNAVPGALDRLCALLRLYIPLRAIGVGIAGESIDEIMRAYNTSTLAIKGWLDELSSLARAAGCPSVYFLIDGIDELATTANNVSTALNLLSPLLDAPGIVQGSSFAFKFFLPASLEEPMRRRHIGRFDRIPTYHLTWSKEELRQMLSRRLRSFSRISETSQESFVTRFNDLCEEDQDAEGLILEISEISPRRLLDLARSIIEEHCHQAEGPYSRISTEIILRILAQWSLTSRSDELDIGRYSKPSSILDSTLRLPTGEQSGISTDLPSALALGSKTDAIRLLYFDERGDIWIGNECRTVIPLTKRLRSCMEYLWEHRHRSIRYEELQKALYAETLHERGDPRSSIDKIIRRLRAVIEPGQPSSHTYISVQPGTGYILRHFEERQESI